MMPHSTSNIIPLLMICQVKLTTLMIYCMMSHRHRPDRPPRDLPLNRCAGSFVHRGPRSAEVTAPDEAG